LALSSAIGDRYGDAAIKVVSLLEEAVEAAQGLAHPSPKFRIGQRVSMTTIDADSGAATSNNVTL
jgi:hypothetical protein